MSKGHSFKSLFIFILSTSLIFSFVAPAQARSGGDEEIEISWIPPSKPKYGQCTVTILSLTPKRDLLAVSADVKDSKNRTVGWHGRVMLNLPVNEKTNKVVKFCNYDKRTSKGPYNWKIEIRYPYTAPERGSVRVVTVPFKFAKKKSK